MSKSNGVSIDRALDAITYRVDTILRETGDRFPLFADGETGEWETTADGNWCGGHWIGLLWLAREYADATADRERFERAARSHTETMEAAMSRRTMFRGMNLHYAGFQGYDHSADRSLFGLGLKGADDMVKLFDGKARQIPSGTLDIEGGDSFEGSDDEATRFEVSSVDNIYTALPVLWRAYRETNNPTFRDVAVSHADRHLDWFLREDGSTWHHAAFDPDTGTLRERRNELAYSEETCWARGLGWNIAGLAWAYRETGGNRYLDALERSVSYYRDRSPDDLIPYWDLEAPSIPDTVRDTSAAGLIAYGLLSLDPGGAAIGELRSTGREVLGSIIESYTITDPDDGRRGAVLHGCYDKPGGYATDDELIWTEYYVAAALHGLTRRGEEMIG